MDRISEQRVYDVCRYELYVYVFACACLLVCIWCMFLYGLPAPKDLICNVITCSLSLSFLFLPPLLDL